MQHIFITLALIVLLRVKSIDAIQYCSPGELGKLLGLDRIPEIKTIRRKLGIVAKQDKDRRWGRDLSKDWLSARTAVSGILYVDGHVRVYHGKQTKLPKRYITRQKLCLRGMTDYWLNDALGQPYFVITTAHTGGLLSMLKSEIIPQLLQDIPQRFSEQEMKENPTKSRFTLIFDREGYSPAFFKEVWEEHRISCYTYKKYPGKLWREEEFKDEEVRFPNGEIVSMKLAEHHIMLGGKISVREIRRLGHSGHQTAIITTDLETPTQGVAANMFSRWSQENFFKYMREHFGIDSLIEYALTPMDETTRVRNPEHRELENQVRSISQKTGRLISKFGVIALEMETSNSLAIERAMIQKAELQENIESYKNQLTELKARKHSMPSHITIAQLPDGEKFHSLAYEKKYIMDTIKMIAYRAETAMALMMSSELSAVSDNRALLRQIFSTEIDIDPDEKNHTLTIVLHSLSTEKANRYATILCQQLNETQTVFPGTNLQLIFKSVAS